MPMKRTLPLALLCLVAGTAILSAGGADAANRHRGQGSRSEQAFADRAISLDEAVAQAERRYKARAVRAEEKRHGDRIEYRIRLLAEDGRVFEVRVDAASGREE
jgi:uncharacterized membrane protein YkoI